MNHRTLNLILGAVYITAFLILLLDIYLWRIV
jgi:hypothetical protein